MATNDDVKLVGARISRELAREFRVVLAAEGRSAQWFLERQIRLYVEKNRGVSA